MRKRITVTAAELQERFDELLAQARAGETELVVEFGGRAFQIAPLPDDAAAN
jgi:antitoxin (DNA-binding transcriptional repressor) of toxin-antitoxin stability system